LQKRVNITKLGCEKYFFRVVTSGAQLERRQALRATPPVLSNFLPCKFKLKLKLEEKNSKHAGLAQQNGFGPAFLHTWLRLVYKGIANPNTYLNKKFPDPSKIEEESKRERERERARKRVGKIEAENCVLSSLRERETDRERTTETRVVGFVVVYLLKSEILSVGGGAGGVRGRVWKDAAAGSFAQAEQEGDSVYVGLCLFRCVFWREVLFCVAAPAAVVVVVVRVCERLRVG
jgi:hypothetical protein